MKIVKFPEANIVYKYHPAALGVYSEKDDPDQTPRLVYRAMFSKEEARFIAKHRELFFLQNTGTDMPLFSFQNPFTQGLSVIDDSAFIRKVFTYKDHEFIVLILRQYDNAKVKARWFQITMDGAWVQSGNLPEKLMSKGSGWLKETIHRMLKDLEKQENK